MRNLLKVIDSISEWTGKAIRWFCVVLVLVMTYEVTMRYAFNAPTIWGYETSMMIGATIYIMGLAYAHRHHAHIRVDVLYMLLPPRGRAIIDVAGTLLFFSPLLIILMYTSAAWTWRSWLIGEKSLETYWYPPLAPIRTMVAIGLCLFALQGAAQFIRDLHLLIRNKPYD